MHRGKVLVGTDHVEEPFGQGCIGPTKRWGPRPKRDRFF